MGKEPPEEVKKEMEEVYLVNHSFEENVVKMAKKIDENKKDAEKEQLKQKYQGKKVTSKPGERDNISTEE